jgi:hypothetical protein
MIERMVLNERQRRHQLASRLRDREYRSLLGHSPVMAAWPWKPGRSRPPTAGAPQGETGTGKGVLAVDPSAGARAEGRSSISNCAGCRDLLESDSLAMKPALSPGPAKPGLIAGAHRGSLFSTRSETWSSPCSPSSSRCWRAPIPPGGGRHDPPRRPPAHRRHHQDLAVAVQEGASAAFVLPHPHAHGRGPAFAERVEDIRCWRITW